MSRYLREQTYSTARPGWRSGSRYLNNYGEYRSGCGLAVSYMAVYYILPQYFGLSLPGFDLTAQRLWILLVLGFVLSKRSRMKVFVEGIRQCGILPLLVMYLVICGYTAVLRFHIGTLLYPLIEVLAAFLMLYLIREYLGVAGAIRLLRRMLTFLCLLGLVEAVMGRTPFAYLETIRGLYTGGMIRSGSYRIMGPANHSLAYGLILISGLPLLCIDEEAWRFDCFRAVPQLVLVIVNVLLTGSRSTLAVMGLELLLLVLLAPGIQKKKILLTVVPAVLLILGLAFAFPTSPPGHYLLLQLATVLDEILGTDYAARFGVDTVSLANSASYREALLDIFTVNWLNPWLGQGSGYHFSWYIPGGATIHSIDNFYVATYIRYGYPGLVCYVLLLLQVMCAMLRQSFRERGGATVCLLLAVAGYFLNLWWMDTLQTIKYAYIPIVLYGAYRMEQASLGTEDGRNT